MLFCIEDCSGIFRTLSNIEDVAFCENSFLNELHRRCLTEELQNRASPTLLNGQKHSNNSPATGDHGKCSVIDALKHSFSEKLEKSKGNHSWFSHIFSHKGFHSVLSPVF